jgi:hypothetical protein
MLKARRMRWTEHVVRMGEIKKECRIMVEKREWKRPHGRPRCRWESTVRINLRGTGLEGVDLIGLVQDSKQ